jgi:uncharacterized protein (DUF1501 family)
MTAQLHLDRRAALRAAAGVGFSLTFLARKAYAAVEGGPAKRKLVVFICRGAMDGLSVSPPVGDPNYASLRREIAIAGFGQPNGALKLDETFGLHPKLVAVHALALKGQARIAPAVATPDRARSHFEAQDVLESGVAVVYGEPSGWLNRAIQAMGPAGSVQAMSVGGQAPLILRGPIQAASWSPGGYHDRDSRLPGILADLYADDPLLGPALASGLQTEAMAKIATEASAPMTEAAQADPMVAAAGQPTANGAPQTVAGYQKAGEVAARSLGVTLAHFMTEPGGPQIAAVSLDGFDTHANQGAADGQLANHLAYLDAAVDGLSSGLGLEWRNTLVLVATEFGRTARINGTKGTDHGTGSTALVLGGGLKPGGIVGDWPTLQEARLFENRDTYPALDMRALFKGALAEQLGIDRRALDAKVFPDSGGVERVRGLV